MKSFEELEQEVLMPPVINAKISSKISIRLYGSTESNRSSSNSNREPLYHTGVIGSSSGDRQEQQSIEQQQQQQQQEVQARLSVPAYRPQEQHQQGLPELLLDSGAAPHFTPTEEGVLESNSGAWSQPQ